MGYLKDLTRSGAGFFGKLILGVATVIPSYLLISDWWDNRVRIETLVLNVLHDEENVNATPFKLTNDELSTVLEADQIDTAHYFKSASAMFDATTEISGRTDMIGKTNLKSFLTGIATMEKSLLHDTLSMSVLKGKSHSIERLTLSIQHKSAVLGRLYMIRDKYDSIMQSEDRILIRTLVANLSGKQTTIVEPAVLQIYVESSEIDTEMDITAGRMSMTFLGVQFMAFGPQSTSIPGKSVKQLTFGTATSKKLGSDWKRIISALKNSNAEARILFYTVDGTVIETESFPFSLDFADSERERRIKHLKQQR